jgi:predicted anti-sigma-YlaC factor YlaD
VAEMNQFGSSRKSNADACAHCEALLMDVLDRTASPEDQAFFDRHLASCTGCSRMFMDAKRGAAFLDMLRNPRPEPSADLFARILAQTSGIESVQDNAANAQATLAGASVAVPVISEFAPVAMPAVAPSPFLYNRPGAIEIPGTKVLPFRVRRAVHSFTHTMLQPRLAMTAAMAFFSIALTLNLTGVHLSALTAEDLKPTSIRKNFNQTTAHVVRYCDNLRVVYELEARAKDLQKTSEDNDPVASPAKTDNGQSMPKDRKSQGDDQPSEQKTRPKPGPGTSRREPLIHDGRLLATAAEPDRSSSHDRYTENRKGDLA